MISWLLPVMGISLTMTLILELTYAFLWGLRGRHNLFLVILVNVLTNPIVVFLHYWCLYRSELNIGIVTLFLEAGAVLTEGLCYRKLGRKIERPFLFALSANAFSYAMGELINSFR